MKKARQTILALAIFSSLFGPLAKIPLNLPSINLYLSDVLIAVLAIFSLISYRKLIDFFKKDRPAKIIFFFSLYALFTLLVSPVSLNLYERIVSLLYLLRFFAYFLVYASISVFLGRQKKSRDTLFSYLNLTGILFVVFGWLQYFLYPDLRNLYYLGWDPHYLRIFGFILDPNYLGILLVIYFLIRHLKDKKSLHSYLWQLIILITIGFTYSRSSFLALLLSLLYFAAKVKKLTLYLSLTVLFLLSLFLLPRPGGEGVKLERLFTIKERIVNWQQAADLFAKHPLFGVGFNTLRFVRKNYPWLSADWLTSHSAAGVDNSFLYLAATSGAIGLFLYLYFLYSLFKSLNILGRTVILATVVHGLFLNTLFFSFVLIWLWTISGITKVNIKGKKLP